MTTGTDSRFEDRLLAQILDDYDELATPDLPAGPTAEPRRRRSRARWAAPAFAAAAAAVVVAVVAVLDSGGASSSTMHPVVAHHPAVRIAVAPRHARHGQAAHHGPHAVLYRLASESRAEAAPTGRYVVFSEIDSESDEPGQSKRTSVDDSQTGASVTYQVPHAGSQAPSKLTEGPDPQSTAAYYASLPTDPTVLRAQLLTIAKRQQAQAQAFFARQAKEAAKEQGLTPAQFQAKYRAKSPEPQVSDDDLVYETADDMLWSPLVSPQLRSSLYQVLAASSGFSVDQNATDPSGRAAVAMTHTTSVSGTPETDVTYENPQTGAVLAQTWKTGATTITAVYQPVTSSNSMPADPYSSN
jgi:hypothetical protein